LFLKYKHCVYAEGAHREYLKEKNKRSNKKKEGPRREIRRDRLLKTRHLILLEGQKKFKAFLYFSINNYSSRCV